MTTQWQKEYEREQKARREKQTAIRDRIWREYQRTPLEGLMSILAASLGKAVVEVLGTDEPGASEDYIHAILFADGTGLMMQYRAETQGYSEYTPGSPARTEYYQLTRKR